MERVFLRGQTIKAAIFLLSASLIVPSFAATYTVDDDGPADFNSIQAAIYFADDNDIIIVHQGTYYEEITIHNKSIILRSTDPNDPCIVNATIIDGNDSYRCIYCNLFNGLITGFTIKNGDAPYGAGIRLIDNTGENFCSVTYCTFMNNNASEHGGAIHSNGIISILDCNFMENSSTFGGAVHCVYNSQTTFENCNFSKNSAYDGGGTYFYRIVNATFTNCTFNENISGFNAGGIYLERDGLLTLNNCSFNRNSSSGIICLTCYDDITLNSCSFNRNFNGGMQIFSSQGNIILNDCTFTANYGQTGGVYFTYSPTATFNDCLFVDNICTGDQTQAANGGAISLLATDATVNNCAFIQNQAYKNGGAINTENSDLNLIFSSFNKNSAYRGGAIHTKGDCTISIANSIFSGNFAQKIGGLRHRTSDPLNLINCTFVGNSAIEQAGAMENSSQNATISNCILWENSTPPPFNLPIYDPVGIEPFEYTYSDIQGGWPGLGNIDTDPCFVDPGYWDPNGTPTDSNDDFWVDGDYHLKSEGWRWDSIRSRWDYDDLTSRCIDVGNPGSLLGDELMTIPNDPNNVWGQNLRINMGAYGGTAEASIPPYDWALLCDIDNNGSIDFDDHAWLALLWMKQDDELFADFNRDTKVDTNDLNLLVNDWLNITTWH